MLQIVKAGNAREEINEFVSRMWSIDDQVAEKLRMTDAAHGEAANRKRREVDPKLRVGAKCWLSTKGITMPWDKERKSMKLRQKYYGPFEILLQTSPVTFKLKLPPASNIHPIFHVGLLRPHEGMRKGNEPQKLPTSTAADNTYEVQEILSHRDADDGQGHYLVKWKDFPYEDCTWEPADNLKGSRRLINNYRTKNGMVEDYVAFLGIADKTGDSSTDSDVQLVTSNVIPD